MAARQDTFTLRMDDDERRMLAAVARHLERSQSDAVRLLIRQAARGLLPVLVSAQPSPAQQGGTHAN